MDYRPRLEDRLPTETFPPDFEELLFPFETEDLEPPLLAELEDLELVLGLAAELLELELGFTALDPELELLLVVVGFCAELLDEELGLTALELELEPLDEELGLTDLVLPLELELLLCTDLPLELGFTLLFTVEDGFVPELALEETERFPEVLLGEA